MYHLSACDDVLTVSPGLAVLGFSGDRCNELINNILAPATAQHIQVLGTDSTSVDVVSNHELELRAFIGPI
jgi:hypothetical protein